MAHIIGCSTPNCCNLTLENRLVYSSGFLSKFLKYSSTFLFEAGLSLNFY